MDKLTGQVGDAVCSVVYSSLCVSMASRQTLGFYVGISAVVIVIALAMFRSMLVR